MRVLAWTEDRLDAPKTQEQRLLWEGKELSLLGAGERDGVGDKSLTQGQVEVGVVTDSR